MGLAQVGRVAGGQVRTGAPHSERSGMSALWALWSCLGSSDSGVRSIGLLASHLRMMILSFGLSLDPEPISICTSVFIK